MSAPWTGREIAILKVKYPVEGTKACVAALPGRSETAIDIMASRLGIRRSREPTRIRETVDPALRFVLEKVGCSMEITRRAEIAADLGTDTIRAWRYRGEPHVGALRRALNALGYDLAVIDRNTGALVP